MSVFVEDYELVTGLFVGGNSSFVPFAYDFMLGFGFADSLAYKVVYNHDWVEGQPQFYLLKQRVPASNT